MNIRIEHLLEGAKRAEGIAIVFDIFRASTTMCALVQQGARVRPVETVEEARHLKRNGTLLVGERNREKIEGADFGNSPFEVSSHSLKGKTIVMTTSAGTRGIRNALGSNEVLVGCFANASALVRYVKEKSPETVTLIGIGKRGELRAAEDDLCAEYIAARLRDEKGEFEAIKKRVLNEAEAVDALKERGLDKDLEACLSLDTYSVVPRYNPKTGFLEDATKEI